MNYISIEEFNKIMDQREEERLYNIRKKQNKLDDLNFSISSRIRQILDTDYKFETKDEKFIKNFVYKQASKYMITAYEDELLRKKFDQIDYSGHSYWVENGLENGHVKYVEKNNKSEY